MLVMLYFPTWTSPVPPSKVHPATSTTNRGGLVIVKVVKLGGEDVSISTLPSLI
jgi:hypothetical protein